MRMTHTAAHKELLPDEEAVLIAQLVEIVALGNTTTPKANQVDTTLTGIAKFGGHTLIAGALHSLRNPVGTTDEDSLAVDVEHS